MAQRITRKPLKIHPVSDFNYNPFFDNYEDIKSLFPGTKASGFFKFNKLPSVNDTIVVNGVTFTFVANDGSAVAATGYIHLTTTPANNDTIVVNGVTFTFKDTVTDATIQIQTNATKDTAGASAATVLNASVNASVSVATYAYDAATDRINVTYDTAGAAGNAFTLAVTGTNMERSAATLTGGQTANVSIGLSGGTIPSVLHNAETVLNASVNGSVSVATYSADTYPSANLLNIEYDTAGEAGEAFTLAVTGTAVTRSAATLELGNIGHANVLRPFIG
jgi:hypothetical protein